MSTYNKISAPCMAANGATALQQNILGGQAEATVETKTHNGGQQVRVRYGYEIYPVLITERRETLREEGHWR